MNRIDARNGFTPDRMTGLLAALPRLAADSSVRVVVTGVRPAFCAGGDVKGFTQRADGTVAGPDFDHRTKDLRARTKLLAPSSRREGR